MPIDPPVKRLVDMLADGSNEPPTGKYLGHQVRHRQVSCFVEPHKRLCYERYCGAECGGVPPLGGVAFDGTGPGTGVPVELNAAGAGAGTADCRSSGTGAGAAPFAGTAADGNGCCSADSIEGKGTAVEAPGRGLTRSTSEEDDARAVVGAFSAPCTVIIMVPLSVLRTKL